MFVALDSTFGAFAAVARPFIQETISETPPTLDTLTRTAPRIRTFLGHSATLFADLRPGIKALSETSPEVASALETAPRCCPARRQLNAQLAPTARTLWRSPRTRASTGGIRRSTQFFDILTPTLRFITPAQTGLQLRDAPAPQRAEPAEPRRRHRHWPAVHVMSAGQIDAFQGRRARTARTAPPRRPPTAPADRLANFLHVNPYPNTAAPGQPHVCAAGNEKYIARQGRDRERRPATQGTTTRGGEQ